MCTLLGLSEHHRTTTNGARWRRGGGNLPRRHCAFTVRSFPRSAAKDLLKLLYRSHALRPARDHRFPLASKPLTRVQLAQIRDTIAIMADNFAYDVFLSHSAKDKVVARALAEWFLK